MSDRDQKAMQQMSTDSDTERRFRDALRTASRILGYAECPPKRLREKLLARGYLAPEIEDALERLASAGLLDEDQMAMRRAEYLYRVKGYGPRRILPELRRLGFSSDAVSMLEFPEDTFDFAARAAVLLKKRRTVDRTAVAALERYGYTGEQIRHAIRIREQEESEELI